MIDPRLLQAIEELIDPKLLQGIEDLLNDIAGESSPPMLEEDDKAA